MTTMISNIFDRTRSILGTEELNLISIVSKIIKVFEPLVLPGEILMELESRYTIQSPGVLDFLKKHENLASFLIEEAYNKIREHFPTGELVLDVLTDPETNEKTLVAFIRTDLNPEEALSKLEKLDEDWWLSAASRAEKLCIHLEFV